MNSLVGQQQGYPDMMDEIPRTYYPGRGYLSDQEAYPENPFYRSPRYSGGIYDGAFQQLPYFGEELKPKTMPYYPGENYGGVQQLAENPMDRFDLMNDPRFPGARRTRDFLRQTEQGIPLDKRNMGREIFPLPLANNAGFYMGPQAGQADQYPPMAAGFLNKYVS